MTDDGEMLWHALSMYVLPELRTSVISMQDFQHPCRSKGCVLYSHYVADALSYHYHHSADGTWAGCNPESAFIIPSGYNVLWRCSFPLPLGRIVELASFVKRHHRPLTLSAFDEEAERARLMPV